MTGRILSLKIFLLVYHGSLGVSHKVFHIPKSYPTKWYSSDGQPERQNGQDNGQDQKVNKRQDSKLVSSAICKRQTAMKGVQRGVPPSAVMKPWILGLISLFATLSKHPLT